MSLVIGHEVIDGVPYINGKPATLGEPVMEEMKDVFSQYRCPECNANLSKDKLICLNACHLSAASMRRFQNLLAEASHRASLKKSDQ